MSCCSNNEQVHSRVMEGTWWGRSSLDEPFLPPSLLVRRDVEVKRLHVSESPISVLSDVLVFVPTRNPSGPPRGDRRRNVEVPLSGSPVSLHVNDGIVCHVGEEGKGPRDPLDE